MNAPLLHWTIAHSFLCFLSLARWTVGRTALHKNNGANRKMKRLRGDLCVFEFGLNSFLKFLCMCEAVRAIFISIQTQQKCIDTISRVRMSFRYEFLLFVSSTFLDSFWMQCECSPLLVLRLCAKLKHIYWPSSAAVTIVTG